MSFLAKNPSFVHGGLSCWYYFLLQSLCIILYFRFGLISIMYLHFKRVGMSYVLEFDYACQADEVCGLVGWVSCIEHAYQLQFRHNTCKLKCH